ncbi:MAG: isoprenylcysteine carboxylmethyltransferase family protein [Deltaproteobacteria bacterium]|nr:isoprenylcysteine carboxylmethyltransferase family protein [Deltaproteobacteria bacterium]
MKIKVSNEVSVNKYLQKLIFYLTILLGAGSLILFMIFLYKGSTKFIDFGLTTNDALILNAVLSFLFFLQHSIMLRNFFKAKVIFFIPDRYHAALFSIASGMVLTTVVIFWQKTDTIIYAVSGFYSIPFIGIFIISCVGFFWGVRALGKFDPFGIRAIKSRKEKRSQKFRVAGPYHWVRHPLYFFMLALIWTPQSLTADRLLFNILWTIWILIGTVLEENDLITELGDVYKKYQKKVPMLFPNLFITKNNNWEE